MKNLVGDLSGFNFIINPYQANTHIFECASGHFICSSPNKGDKYKYQHVIREATNKEVRYFAVAKNKEKALLLEKLEKAYNSASNSHKNSVIDLSQGLPCDVLPMDAALSEVGFSDPEIKLLESSSVGVGDALIQIIEQRTLTT